MPLLHSKPSNISPSHSVKSKVLTWSPGPWFIHSLMDLPLLISPCPPCSRHRSPVLCLRHSRCTSGTCTYYLPPESSSHRQLQALLPHLLQFFTQMLSSWCGLPGCSIWTAPPPAKISFPVLVPIWPTLYLSILLIFVHSSRMQLHEGKGYYQF